MKTHNPALKRDAAKARRPLALFVRFRMHRLRSLHLTIGMLAVVAFVLTGQYMHWVHNHLQGMPDGPRLFYRSSHIYLLWSSLLNVLLGCYLSRPPQQFFRHAQTIASFAILAGPFLLCTSFFVELYNPALLRPVGRLAIFLAFVGVLAHAAIAMISRAKSET